MADTFANICSAGQQAGLVAGPAQRSTKVEQFYGKMKVFKDQIQRIVEDDERIPSGADVANVLKYFQQTLLSWIKESQTYFDEESRQFSCHEHPSVDFDLLCAMLLNSLGEAKQVIVEKQDYVDAILNTLACLVPFLSHNNLLALPTKIASTISNLPASSHSKAVNLTCGYLLPLLLGALPLDYCKENSRIGLSSPALLLSIFQSCTDQSLYLKIVETLMTYTRNVCGDLLYVMAYGTQDVLEPAIHMLNRYFPAVEIGTVTEYRSAKDSSIVWQRCEYELCAKYNAVGVIRTADLVCLDPCICSSVQSCPPPVFLCTSCAELLNANGSSLFVDIVRSIGNVSELCESQDCESSSKAGRHFCMSPECTRKNNRKPLRLCYECNESLHGKRGSYEDHIVHSCLNDLWSMKNPTQTYLVDTMARLLKEAHPSFGERCVEMGIDLDTIMAINISDKRDADYYKRITRSMHGLSLLKALSPIPPSIYSYEHISRLLSMLFAWLETVAHKTHIHVKIVEIVERYQTQAIDWIKKVEHYDFNLYCDCLLPLPPFQARIGLAWESLMSENRQLLEGLQRLLTLVKLDLLSEKVWERILPFWMQEVKERVKTPDELVNFKVILRRLFDVNSDISPSYSLNFIERKLQNVVNTQRQESLTWIQLLSAVDVCLDVGALIVMFVEASQHVEISEDEQFNTIFQFPDPQSYREPPVSPGLASPSPGASPFVFPSINVVDNSITYHILMMDILIKQISLRKSVKNIPLNAQESFYLAKLLVAIVHKHKDSKRCLHSGQVTPMLSCVQKLRHPLDQIILEALLRTRVSFKRVEIITLTPHQRLVTITDWLKQGQSESAKSSTNSRVSSNTSFVDARSPQRTASTDSELDFDETATSLRGHVSSTGVDEADSVASGDVSCVASLSEESEQDSLLAWKNKIKGISEGVVPGASNAFDLNSNNWSTIYNANPEIELTMLLLQHVFKHSDASVLCHILKCITMTCIRGECLRVSAREDMDLTHYLQTVLFIPSLWEMLQANNSCLAQQAVPLLLHCVCMPYGAGRLCDEIENIFNNEDWMKRFSAVEKVSLLCDFIVIDMIRDSALAKSTLVHGLVYLISAIDDVHDAVAAKARTAVSSINRISLQLLYCYMEEHFRKESEDRLMLLHSWRTLSLTLDENSPFCPKFFTNLLCCVITRARSSVIGSSRGSSFSSTMSENNEALHTKPHIPLWSRALSSPGRSTGIANWVNSGNMGINRPRSASAPLVLYKQKFTLQFDRQTSLLGQTFDDTAPGTERSNSQRRRKNWSHFNDPFNKGGKQDSPLLGGVIESHDVQDEVEQNGKRRESTSSSATSSSKSSSKSTYLQQVDDVVLHYLVTLLMEHLSKSKAVNSKTCSLDELRKLRSTLMNSLIALASDVDEEEPVFKAAELRQCTVFLAFMFNVTAVLDSNPYVGKEFLPLTLNLMLQCIADAKDDNNLYPEMLLDVLDPPLQQGWLMNLLIILYKYEFAELKSSLIPLITVVVNTINSHQHYLCVKIQRKAAAQPRDANKSFPKRIRGRKGSKLRVNGKRRAKLEKINSPKVAEEGSSKNATDIGIELTRLKNDSRSTETSLIESTSSGSPMSQGDGQLSRGDSDSASSYDEEMTLQDLFSLQRCSDCQSCMREYEEETVNLCIVVLSTFIHRDPEMAAPLLMEILGVVSRKALPSGMSVEDSCASLKPRSSSNIAKQFIRCIFVQLSPNGLFPELFRCEIFDEHFFKAVISSLFDFDKLSEMKPLKNILQDFTSRSNRDDRVTIFLQNLDIYLQFLPKENVPAWENILHDFESFFKALLSVLPAPFEASSLLQIMKKLLGIGRHYAKSLLPSFGHILAHVIRKCDFKIENLQKVCFACTCAFSKDREKHFFARAILQDLSLTMKNKISMHERNVKKIVQLIYLEGDSWFSFEHGDSDVKKTLSKQNIGFMACVQGYQQDLLECTKHWDYRIKDVKEIDDDSIDENYFPVQLKASLSQVVVLCLSSHRDKAMKAYQRIFSWLRNPPSQLGRVDVILDSVANLRALSWLLIGSINHIVDHPGAREIVHFISMSENANLTDYIKIVLQSVLRQDIEKNVRHLRPALYMTFVACQLWTIYCECHLVFHMNSESDALATVMEFWSQITFTLVQLLNENDKVKQEVLLPFIKIMDGIAKCSGFSFPRLSTLWCPLVHFYKNEIPEDLYTSFKYLQSQRGKSKDLKGDLHDLVRRTRSRLSKLEKAGNKFDHSFVV